MKQSAFELQAASKVRQSTVDVIRNDKDPDMLEPRLYTLWSHSFP